MARKRLWLEKTELVIHWSGLRQFKNEQEKREPWRTLRTEFEWRFAQVEDGVDCNFVHDSGEEREKEQVNGWRRLMDTGIECPAGTEDDRSQVEYLKL